MTFAITSAAAAAAPCTITIRHRSLAFGFVLLTYLSSVAATTAAATANKSNIIESLTTSSSPSTSLPNTSSTSTPATTITLPQFTTTITTSSSINHSTLLDDNLTNNEDHRNRVNSSAPQQLVIPVANNATTMIDLSRRNITSLTGLLLPSSDILSYHVQSLNLSANHLERLQSGAFANASSLRSLDLARNDIALIEAHAFATLAGLQHLNLSSNALTTLADETFKELRSLQQLDLSLNALSTIAPGALELASLTRLVLAGNAHLGDTLPSSAPPPPLFIATGRRLQTLDATRTALRHVPSALTHSIRTLHLAENRIRLVSRGALDSYPLLQLLDLSRNELTDIEEDALGRLEMLAVLYLTDNRLTTMPHSLPEHLHVLHLERNEITALDAGDFDGLPQLEVLLLAGNRIRTIGDGAFVQLPNLVTLDLSQNSISELPAGSLAGPTRLRLLRLAQLNVSFTAQMEATTAFPLPATEYLITLDLSGSPAVARQWLDDTAALAAARELQELDVSGCALETLPADTLHYLPQLRALHLRDNALNCTGLEWLAEWMRLQEAAEYGDVRCQSPGDLWGTLLVDLQSLHAASIDASTLPPRVVKKVAMNISPADATIASWLTAITATRSSSMQSISTSPPTGRRNLFMRNSSAYANAQTLTGLQQVNISRSEAATSMYSLSSPPPHPGMYLLIVGIMGATLVLITLTSRMSRRTRDDLQMLRAYRHDSELIEVSSLPSVTELW